MKFIWLILKSLTRSKRRTILILSTITLSVFLVTVLQSLLTTLNAVSNNPNSSNRLVVRHKSGLTQMLPMSYLPYLKEILAYLHTKTACANRKWRIENELKYIEFLGVA